jgi:hypothetical protein
LAEIILAEIILAGENALLLMELWYFPIANIIIAKFFFLWSSRVRKYFTHEGGPDSGVSIFGKMII